MSVDATTSEIFRHDFMIQIVEEYSYVKKFLNSFLCELLPGSPGPRSLYTHPKFSYFFRVVAPYPNFNPPSPDWREKHCFFKLPGISGGSFFMIVGHFLDFVLVVFNGLVELLLLSCLFIIDSSLESILLLIIESFELRELFIAF